MNDDTAPLSSGWEGVPRCRGSWLKNASTVRRQFRSPNASVSTAMCRAQPRTQHQLALEWSHDLQSTCLGSEDTTSHLQASHEAGGHRTRTAKFQRKSWRKMGLPLLTEKIANNIWTTLTWAVYEGDVPIMPAFRSIFGWRTAAWWRSRASKENGVGPLQGAELEAQIWVS